MRITTSGRHDPQGPPPTIAPEQLPELEAWRTFVPPVDAVGYVKAHLSVTDMVLLLNLITPSLIEVEGCVLLKDRYSPTRFKEWSVHLDGSIASIESVTNQVNLWDVFNPEDVAEEEALEPVAEFPASLARARTPPLSRSRDFDSRHRVLRLWHHALAEEIEQDGPITGVTGIAQ